jgi:hypothetical protein
VAFPAIVPVLKVYRGDTFSASFVIKSDDSPLDFVSLGWGSWSAQWREKPLADNPVAFTVDSTSASSGCLKITMAASNTATLKDGYWDLQATKGGEVKTWLRGEVLVQQDVTRAS